MKEDSSINLETAFRKIILQMKDQAARTALSSSKEVRLAASVMPSDCSIPFKRKQFLTGIDLFLQTCESEVKLRDRVLDKYCPH